MFDRADKFPEVPAMSAMRFSSHISELEKYVFNRFQSHISESEKYVFNRFQSHISESEKCFQSHISESEKCFQSHISESEKCVIYRIYAKWIVHLTRCRILIGKGIFIISLNFI
jgi:hypothetical protein